MSFIRAIVVDPEAPGRLAIKEIAAPQADPTTLNGGTYVVAGVSASSSATIDFMSLIRAGRTTIYVLNRYAEYDNRPGSEDLAWLAQLVAEQKLQTSIEVEASWHDVGEVTQHLLRREFTGKAVLHLS